MGPGHIFDVVATVCFGVSAVPWAGQEPYWRYVVSLGLVFLSLGHLFGGG